MKVAIISKNDELSGNCKDYIISSNLFEFVDIDCKTSDLDFIISIGGDGTTLKCVPFATKFGVPIVSLNTGNVGFLSAYAKEEIQKLLLDLKNGSYLLEDRELLELEISNKRIYALNEVVVERNHSSCQIAVFDFCISGEEAISYSGDGILVSTPTGSTGYSHSAGGAILYPSVKALVATAICPRKTNANSIVYPIDKEAQITVQRAELPCGVFVDGVKCGELQPGEHITINASITKLKIIKTKQFFTLLNQKIN